MDWKHFVDALFVKSGRIIPDKMYLRVRYWACRGYWMDFKHPYTLNEKLQWLKLYNRRPEYTTYTDKYAVKEFISRMLGEEFVIPTLGVWNTSEEIDFDSLPSKFVIKPTHNSFIGRVICSDKSKLDVQDVRLSLSKALKQNYFYEWREWPYKNIVPRIIAEQYLQNSDGTPIVDYKFYCFGGEPRYFMYSKGEADHTVRNCKFDLDGNCIDHLFKKNRTISDDEIRLPSNLQEMISVVRKLAVGHPHVRVDLYNVDGHIYFGEMTFFSGAGFIDMDSAELSQQMADLIPTDKKYEG